MLPAHVTIQLIRRENISESRMFPGALAPSCSHTGGYLCATNGVSEVTKLLNMSCAIVENNEPKI